MSRAPVSVAHRVVSARLLKAQKLARAIWLAAEGVQPNVLIANVCVAPQSWWEDMAEKAKCHPPHSQETKDAVLVELHAFEKLLGLGFDVRAMWRAAQEQAAAEPDVETPEEIFAELVRQRRDPETDR